MSQQIFRVHLLQPSAVPGDVCGRETLGSPRIRHRPIRKSLGRERGGLEGRGGRSPERPSLSPPIPLPILLNILSRSLVPHCRTQGRPCGQNWRFSVMSHWAMRLTASSGARASPGLDRGFAGHCSPERMEILLTPGEYLTDEFPGGGTLQQRRQRHALRARFRPLAPASASSKPSAARDSWNS